MLRMERHLDQPLKSVITLSAGALLGSCSYQYDVEAVAIGGRLAIASRDPDYRCLANIMVQSSEASATPGTGDDRLLVVDGGAFWWTENPVVACKMEYPILYGHAAAGIKVAVAPKKLKIGVLYEVRGEGEGAYASGCFRISDQRTIENLPHASCFEARSRAYDRLAVNGS